MAICRRQQVTLHQITHETSVKPACRVHKALPAPQVFSPAVTGGPCVDAIETEYEFLLIEWQIAQPVINGFFSLVFLLRQVDFTAVDLRKVAQAVRVRRKGRHFVSRINAAT